MERNNTSIAIDESRSGFLDTIRHSKDLESLENWLTTAGTGKVQDDLVRLMVPKTKEIHEE